MMPAAFIGHGSPMNALERNRYTTAWAALAAAAPRPRAVVCVSAHWYINATAVTAMASPRTIHDFYGFPEELFAVRYPAPGAPELVEEIAAVAKPHWVGADLDSWGIDHGAWSVLVHMYPDASVPVVQLALNAAEPASAHFELGVRLAALRERDVMVLGSGNVVHNLRLVDFRRPEHGEPWARRFDEAVAEVLTGDPAGVLGLAEHSDYRLAVPTPDHYLPMLYVAGMAAASGEALDVLTDGYVGGSLSMTSYTLGVDTPQVSSHEGPSAQLPVVPAEDSNL
jgi:4,5-DOPA dioxygenase extradiol